MYLEILNGKGSVSGLAFSDGLEKKIEGCYRTLGLHLRCLILKGHFSPGLLLCYGQRRNQIPSSFSSHLTEQIQTVLKMAHLDEKQEAAME